LAGYKAIPVGVKACRDFLGKCDFWYIHMGGVRMIIVWRRSFKNFYEQNTCFAASAFLLSEFDYT
jgi:hypothetical protein